MGKLIKFPKNPLRFDTMEQAWEHAERLGGNFFVVQVPNSEKFTLIKFEGKIAIRKMEKPDAE